jgi:hypothetical protein
MTREAPDMTATPTHTRSEDTTQDVRAGESFRPELPEVVPPVPPRTSAPRGSGPSLSKITVNLVPRAAAALEEASGLTHDTKTETINRALQLYAWFQRMTDAGCKFRVVDPNGAQTELKVF